MNIFLLAPHPYYTNRGTPIAVRLVCEGLSAMGHTVDVLTYHEGEDVAVENVTIHRIARPRIVKRVPIGPSWQKLVCDVFMWRKLKAMLRAKRYDVIHATEEASFMAARLTGGDRGIPFVFDMDSLMSRQIVEKQKLLWPAAKVFEVLERHALRRTAGVLAVCQALVDEASKYSANVHLLPDVAMAGDAPGSLPEGLTSASGVRFLYVGNLETYQGVDLMLEGFARMAKDRQGVVLLVVGGKADHIAAYREKADALGVGEQVKFVGPAPVESLGRVLACADILVSPRTRGENTPMKLYSYLLSGKPVLATNLPTHTQAVGPEHAMLVEPTAMAMAQGMAKLADDAALRQKLGDAGRQLAQREYSLDAYRRRLANFYQQLEQGLTR